MSATTVTRRDRGLIVSRFFTAPRELVFRALSEAEQLMQWWGPPSCPVVECTVDFRPGGVWHYRLRLPDGGEAWARSVYREITPPERISYLERSSDADGAVTDERPAAFCVITLDASGEGTVLTATLQYESPLDRDRAIRNGVEQGFPAALLQLDALLGQMTRSL